MTTVDGPLWGPDSDRFDGYALADAEAIARVLLPLVVDGTVEECPWRVALSDHGWTGRIDGYISWDAATELPGDGSSAPRHQYQRAVGRIPRSVLDVLVPLLEADGPATWHASHGMHAVETPLRPPALDEAVPPPTTARRSPRTAVALHGALRTLADIWRTSPFPGRAWRDDGRMSIAAPPYADSIIVSAPDVVIDRLTASELEAFRVARSAPLPRMTE